jgi:hypothetical protein
VLLNDVGKQYRSTIDRIEVNGRTPERARNAALRRFERKHKVSEWHHLAHGCEREGP